MDYLNICHDLEVVDIPILVLLGYHGPQSGFYTIPLSLGLVVALLRFIFGVLIS